MFFTISHVFFRVCFWDVKTTRKILPFMSMQITKKQKFSDVCGTDFPDASRNASKSSTVESPFCRR